MKILFTKKQFKQLLRLIYLGNWMVNAIRNSNERVRECDEIEQYIYSFAKEFGMKDLIEFDQEFRKYFPTSKFEESEVQKFIDEYNEDNFWEELFDKMVNRDMIKRYGLEKYLEMSFEERIEKEEPFRQKYDQEFKENGIQNLEIRDQ